MDKMAISKEKFEQCDEEMKAKFDALEEVRRAIQDP